MAHPLHMASAWSALGFAGKYAYSDPASSLVMLLHGKRRVQAASTNTMKGIVSTGKPEQTEWPAPPRDAQRAFGRQFDAFMLSMAWLRAAADAADALSALVDRAFAGGSPSATSTRTTWGLARLRGGGPHVRRDGSLSEDAWHVRAEKPRFLDGLRECRGRAAQRLELRPRVEPCVDDVEGVADLFGDSVGSVVHADVSARVRPWLCRRGDVLVGGPK